MADTSPQVLISSPASVGDVIFTDTVTSTRNGLQKNGIENFTVAEFLVTSSSVTGTSPTFDVYIQTLLPDGVTWEDLVHFTQITNATSRRALFVTSSATSDAALSSSALAAGTIASGKSLGASIRVRVVVGGTNPSAVLNVWGTFLN